MRTPRPRSPRTGPTGPGRCARALRPARPPQGVLRALAAAGLGCDLADVARMRRELARPDGGFRDDVFTPSEIAYCAAKRYPERHFAARFAAKEAALKALGTGVTRWSAWREVEVVRAPDGAPAVRLHGRVAQTAAAQGVRKVRLSLAHTARTAMATVLLEGARRSK